MSIYYKIIIIVGGTILSMMIALSLVVLYNGEPHDRHFLGWFALISILALIVSLGLLYVLVSTRLTNLSERVKYISHNHDDLTLRLPVLGNDELSDLARAINGMLGAKAHLIMKVDGQHQVMRYMARRLINAQEEERRRISRELHDDLGQVLTALKLSLDLAQQLAPTETSEKYQHFMKQAIKLAIQAHERARHLSVQLHPSILEDLGLAAALRWEIDHYQQNTGQTVHFDYALEQEDLPHELSITIYRLIMEALTNITRHAQAHQIWIVIETIDDNKIFLQIKDDGVGFAAHEWRNTPEQRRSLGLVSMQERVQLLDGVFEINSKPNAGTHIKVYLAIPKGELL